MMLRLGPSQLCRKLKSNGYQVIGACRKKSPELESLGVKIVEGRLGQGVRAWDWGWKGPRGVGARRLNVEMTSQRHARPVCQSDGPVEYGYGRLKLSAALATAKI